MLEYSEFIRVMTALGILIGGFVVMKLFRRIFIKVRRVAVRESFGVSLSALEKVFLIFVLIAALVVLGYKSVNDFAYKLVVLLPQLLMFVLLLVLGVLLVQLISWVLERIIVHSRLEEVVSEDVGHNLIAPLMLLIKIVLYVVLFTILLRISNVPQLQSLAGYILYPVLFVVVLILFVGLINPTRDLAASFYLKNMWAFKPGNSVKYNGRFYVINSIGLFSTELKTDSDYLVVPNRVLSSNGLEFRKPSRDLLSLEELKNRFVAQLPSMCGPASAQIVLSIFDINADQKDLAKLAESIQRTSDEQVAAGTHPKKLISAVEKFTDEKVKGAWISFDKIYDLKEEVSVWLNEGALLIIDYKKRYLFPSATRAHYSVVVGLRGDELLVIDPSGKKGGVYYVDYRDAELGMDTFSDLIQGKRGYIVLAPMGTAAFQRIVDKLIYHHASMYNKISKSLEMKLNKFTSTPVLLDLLPPFVRKYIKSNEQISRVWSPPQKE